MKVLKFGGTSVGSAKNINKVIDILKNYSKDDSIICIVSAVGGITDKLIHVANLALLKDLSYKDSFMTIKKIHEDIITELIPNKNKIVLKAVEDKLHELESLLDGIYLINELSPKTSDKLVSYGELLSSFIIAETMRSRGLEVVRKNSQDLVVTNSSFTKAEVDFALTNKNIRDYFKKSNQSITILPGFISKSKLGEITTLGRGGSDTTAVALAAALDAEHCQIWTDVAGVYSGHPGMVPDAPLIPELNFEEMLALADSGAQVLKASAVELAKRNGVEIGVGSSFSRQMGSRICDKDLDRDRVTGVALEEEVVLMTLANTRPGSNFALIAKLAAHGLAVKSIWERRDECGLFFSESDLAEAGFLIEDHYGDQPSVCLSVNRDLALLSVVGAGIGFGTDIMVRTLEVFAQMEIQPEHYFSSEMRMSFAIERQRAAEAVSRIHEVLIGEEQQLATSS